MVDNVTADAGTGGAVFATDDIGGVHYPITKLTFGALDSQTIASSGAGNSDAGTQRVVIASDQAALTVNAHAVTNAGTFAVQAAVDELPAAAALTDNFANPTTSQIASMSMVWDGVTWDRAPGTAADGTLVNLGANNDVTITGTVTVDGSGVTQPVSGTVDLGTANVTNAGTFATQVDGAALTALQLIDNSIFADDAAFTLTSSSVNMAGAIRDDSLSTLTAIEGDAVPLRVSSTGALHVTGGGGGTEYSEDVATPATIVGTATMMERDDALSTLTPIEGDWAAMRCDANGALWVNVSNADGTSAVDTAAGGTDTGAVMLAVRDDTLTTLTPADGDYTHLRVSSTGALHVTGGGGGTEYVVNAAAPADPTGTASLMERDDALATLTEIEGDWTNMRSNANGALWTAVDGTVTVANGGTFAVQAAQSGTWNVTNVSGTVSLPTGAATAANQATQTTALQLLDNPIVAHDAAATGSTGVSMAGARATNNVEGITQVANADATRIQADLNGVLLSRPHTTLEEILSNRVADTAGTSTAFSNFGAGGAGIHNYVTTLTVFNSSATDGYVDIRDGTAGAILFTVPAPAAGGSVINFPVPLKGAANTALAYDVSGALTTVYISVVGFQAQG